MVSAIVRYFISHPQKVYYYYFGEFYLKEFKIKSNRFHY